MPPSSRSVSHWQDGMWEMVSEIRAGGSKEQLEPRQGKPYKVLSLPSTVAIDYVPNTRSDTRHSGVKETVLHVKISELNKVLLPMDANPRKPEHIKSIVETLQSSAQKPSPNIFVYKNNGIDVFCKKLTFVENQNVGTITVEFGNQDSHDGICNGGLTYYSLQGLTNLPDDSAVKMRFYEFDGAPLSLKSEVAKAKNQNRSVASTDDANFMGYFDHIKEKLGDYVDLVKWETGDIELATDNPIHISTLVRYLSALRIDEPYHWDLNPNQHTLSSHKSKTNLLTQSSKFVEDFIENMRGES